MAKSPGVTQADAPEEKCAMEPSYWRSCLQIPKVRYPYEKDHPLKVLGHAFTDVGVEMRLDWRLGLEHAVGLGKGLKPRKHVHAV